VAGRLPHVFCVWWLFLNQKRSQQSINFACKFGGISGDFEFGGGFKGKNICRGLPVPVVEYIWYVFLS
jgi:hypothetical protein